MDSLAVVKLALARPVSAADAGAQRHHAGTCRPALLCARPTLAARHLRCQCVHQGTQRLRSCHCS